MNAVLKIIASIAVVLGGGYIGFLAASALKVRVKQIEQFRLAIEQMGFSISFLKMPVADALSAAAKSRSGAVGRILIDASGDVRKNKLSPSSAFRRAVLKNRNSLCMTDDDIEIITEFASGLGMGDTDAEVSNIRAACARLQIAQSAAEGVSDSRGKMWRGIGYLGGIFAVVILF